MFQISIKVIKSAEYWIVFF